MDVLSDVLRAVRLTGGLFFPMDVSSPWVDEIPAATEFASIVLPGAEHVFSLAFDAKQNALYAATGPQGKLFRISAGGEAQVVGTVDVLVHHGESFEDPDGSVRIA